MWGLEIALKYGSGTPEQENKLFPQQPPNHTSYSLLLHYLVAT